MIKKIIGIVVLGIVLISCGNRQEVIEIEEVYRQHKYGDPPSMVYDVDKEKFVISTDTVI